MATLIDHTLRSRVNGTVEGLTALMVSAQVIAYPLRLKGSPRIQACESVVRAAIRRGGRTDAGQELVMEDAERRQWERDNPEPEW